MKEITCINVFLKINKMWFTNKYIERKQLLYKTGQITDNYSAMKNLPDHLGIMGDLLALCFKYPDWD